MKKRPLKSTSRPDFRSQDSDPEKDGEPLEDDGTHLCQDFGAAFFRRVGVPADRTWQAGRLPYEIKNRWPNFDNSLSIWWR